MLSDLVGFSSHILSVLVGSSWAGKKDLLGLFGPGKKKLGPVGPVKNLLCPVGRGEKNCWVQLGREKTC